MSPEASCGRAALCAYGKTVWSWPSLLRSSSCGCGICVNRRGVGDFRRGEGGQNELGSRESTAYAVRPLRREGRVFGFTCMPLCSSSACAFAQRTVGASRHPAFPAPSFLEGVTETAKLGRNAPRGCCGVSALAMTMWRACAFPLSSSAGSSGHSPLNCRMRLDVVETADALHLNTLLLDPHDLSLLCPVSPGFRRGDDPDQPGTSARGARS
ncbi:hypothetical protein ACVWXQ_004615 [Bradyrhizobium sp. S3.14.4]